jgi:hypothetical protein
MLTPSLNATLTITRSQGQRKERDDRSGREHVNKSTTPREGVKKGSDGGEPLSKP